MIGHLTNAIPRAALAIAIALAMGAGPVRAAEAPQPIRFKPGADKSTVGGAVVGGDRDLYSLRARAGQTMTVRITSPENNAVFSIWRPGAVTKRGQYGTTVRGKALRGAGETSDAMRWSGRLPASGVYLFVIGPTRGNATYRLTVSIR